MIKSFWFDFKQLKQELAGLLEEDAKADALRRLPLYSCKITGWKFVCSKCLQQHDIAKILSALVWHIEYCAL